MSLAEHVRILGRGQGRARSLTQDEARAAMVLMLREDADPHAVGALLMLMRMKGEVAEEIAGFVEAAQKGLPAFPAADLDWSSYAAGRTRGLPWFLLSARLVARAGYSVALHGWNGPDETVRNGLAEAGIAKATSPEMARNALETDGIVYLPLESLSPRLKDLIGLRSVLGLRSCLNTVARMLNPTHAKASVQGVFHPSYRQLQSDAASLLGQRRMTVIKGGGGEFERHPGKGIQTFGLRDGLHWEGRAAPHLLEVTRLAEGVHPDATLTGLWSGAIRDPFAEATIIGTAALALDTLGVPDSEARARDLWDNRLTAKAA